MNLRPNSVSPHVIRPTSKTLLQTKISFPQNQIRSYAIPIKSYWKDNDDGLQQSYDLKNYQEQIEKDNHHLQKQLMQKIQTLNEKAGDYEKLQLQCNQLEEWNNQLQQALDQKSQEHARQKKKYDGHLNQVVTMKANYEIEIKELSSQVKQMNRNISQSRPDSQVEFLEGEVQQLQDLMSMKSRENTVMSNNLKIMSEEIKKLQIKVETSKLIIPDSLEEVLKVKLNQKDKEIEILVRENSILQNDLDKNSNNDIIRLLKKEIGQLDSHNTKLIQQINQDQQALKVVQSENAQIISHNKDKIKVIEQELKGVQQEKLQLQSQNKDNLKVIEQQQTDILNLQKPSQTSKDYKAEFVNNYELDGTNKGDISPSQTMLRYEQNQLKVQLAEKTRKAEQQQEFIKKLQDLLEIKTEECDEQFKLRQISEKKINSLSEDLQIQKSKINHIEREKIVDQEELQVKLHVNHQHITQTIKSDYEKKMLKMQDEIFDLKRNSSTTTLSGVFNSAQKCKGVISHETLL